MSIFSIVNFLEDRKIEFENKNGVFFVLLPATEKSAGILLHASFPGFSEDKSFELSLSACYDTEESLQRYFPIQNSSELINFPVSRLLAGFESGLACVSCCVDKEDGNGLKFRKIDNRLIASDENISSSHEVFAPISSPEDYINYTIAYFRK